MSNRPIPAALTTAMLAQRAWRMSSEGHGPIPGFLESAQLASSLHRLAPALKRQAEAECNGEFYDGQRAKLYERMHATLDANIAKRGLQLDRRVAKLNVELSAFGCALHAKGDPRGCCAELRALDGAPTLPSNGWECNVWGIA